MPRPKETEYLDKYLSEVIKDGKAEVWTEVVTPDGIADAVILEDGQYTIIEGKAQLSYALLAQCLRWEKYTTWIEAVIPYQPRENEALDLAIKHFSSNGIYVSMVGSFISDIAHGGYFETEDCIIKNYLRDSQRYNGRFAKAGTAGGKRATKKNEDYQAIEDHIKENPGCTAASAASVGGMKAMKLLKLIERGEVRAKATKNNGKSELFPLD